MAQSHLIALPAQELSALLCAATSPQFAPLFKLLPAFHAALRAPVDDELCALTVYAQDAIGKACDNTKHPEDWEASRELAERLSTQKRAQELAQAAALQLSPPRKPAYSGNTQCPCCTGTGYCTTEFHGAELQLLNNSASSFQCGGLHAVEYGSPWGQRRPVPRSVP